MAAEAWLGGELSPAEGQPGWPLSEEQVLQRVDRIRVADAVVRAEAQLQEVRRGFHGLDPAHCELLLAYLASGVAVTRRGLAEARADSALLRQHRFGPVLDSRPSAGRAAREGESGRLPDHVRLAHGLDGRPRAALGYAADVIEATRRVNCRQTLLQARETRLRVNRLDPEYIASEAEVRELEEARVVAEHPLVPDTAAVAKAAPARPAVASAQHGAWDPWDPTPQPLPAASYVHPAAAAPCSEAFLRGIEAAAARRVRFETAE